MLQSAVLVTVSQGGIWCVAVCFPPHPLVVTIESDSQITIDAKTISQQKTSALFADLQKAVVLLKIDLIEVFLQFCCGHISRATPAAFVRRLNWVQISRKLGERK
jgi:hypothetical protein